MKKIREYSIPLILGVVVALLCANIFPAWYETIVNTAIVGKISLHWLVNDIFMVFFFASAGIEIVNSLCKGGALNPIKKAVTPLMATAGGVLGPVAIFFILNTAVGQADWANGWGITVATDIAIAWLAAKLVFGRAHPAVSFLLLLAVADDAIGLFIIAIFYPDPNSPVNPIWLLMVVLGMGIALVLRKKGIHSLWPYIVICGGISWFGMLMAHLHPALSMVAIVPFIPRNCKLVVPELGPHGPQDGDESTTLGKFEKGLAPIVDYGLFFFGFANAGVAVAEMSTLTWIITLSVILGKIIGITGLTFISGKILRFGLPKGMVYKEVFVVGIIGGIGLTVALFVTQSAYTDLSIIGAAKMGALFTSGALILALIAGKVLGIKKV